MAITMTKLQRSNWVGMLKSCRLSAHSDGTRRPPARSYGTHPPPPPPPPLSDGTHPPPPPPPAHSDGTHRLRVLPKHIWEDMLKRWDLAQPREEAQQAKYEMAANKQQQGGGSNSFVKHRDGRPSTLSEAVAIYGRVYNIAMQFKFLPPDATPEQVVDMLDELRGYAEIMELAHQLYYIGCLELLDENLLHSHAGVRAKTAELLTTMVHNNPRNQRLVFSLDSPRRLFHNLILDPDATSRTKSLGAISALIRNNEPDNPGITEFQQADGYVKLMRALRSKNDVRLQREALNLIEYLLHENSSHCGTVTELGLPDIMIHLASSDDAEVREAALRCLLVLARDEGVNSGRLVKNDDKLKQVLQERIERISAMASEDLGAATEERQLMNSLWNACFNEPPSFGEKCLPMFRGEDAPAPDVASKQFEPPPRAWAAAVAADSNSFSVKDCNIFNLGLPHITICLAASKNAKARVAAFRSLLVLARDEGGNSGQLVQNDDKLKQVLQKRIEGINAMAPEDLGAAGEEIHLVDSLWNVCYNEHSSLKLFEPSL